MGVQHSLAVDDRTCHPIIADQSGESATKRPRIDQGKSKTGFAGSGNASYEHSRFAQHHSAGMDIDWQLAEFVHALPCIRPALLNGVISKLPLSRKKRFCLRALPPVLVNQRAAVCRHRLDALVLPRPWPRPPSRPPRRSCRWYREFLRRAPASMGHRCGDNRARLVS